MAIKRHNRHKEAQPRAARGSQRAGRESSASKRKPAAPLEGGGSQPASEEVYEGSGASPLSVVRRANDSKTSAINR